MNSLPITSIIILVKNGGSLLQNAIKMIFAQKTNFSFEVIVVDSGSTDGSLKFIKKYPIKLFQIKPEDFSFGPTRDFGFSQAQGKYIVTISQDVVPANENFLQNLITPLIKNEADVVQGTEQCPQDKSFFFWDRKGLFYRTTEAHKFYKKYGNISLSCTSLAITKTAWQETKFSPAIMSEDKEIQKKLFAKGYRMMKEKSALANHGHTYTLRSLKKRCENEGMGWKYVGINYTFLNMLKDLIQPKWVYGIFIKNLVKGEIRTLSEVLFLWIRPIFLYKGNKYQINFKH